MRMTQIIKAALHCLREEFTTANLWFQHPQPRRLLEPQCSGRSLPYVLYRICISTYFFIIIIYDSVSYTHGAKWFIFLTDWFYLVLTLQALLLAFAVTFHYERAKRAQPGEAIYKTLAWPLKALWFIQNLCLSGALLITMVYWGWTIYEEVDTTIDLPNVTAHGLITAYVLVDSFICGIPVRLLHFWQPPLLGCSYSVFSWIYWACGGTSPEGKPYIYSIMDYSVQPKEAMGYTALLCLLSMFLHLCMFGLYKVRVWLYEAACCVVCCCLPAPSRSELGSGEGEVQEASTEKSAMMLGTDSGDVEHCTETLEVTNKRGERCLLQMEVSEV